MYGIGGMLCVLHEELQYPVSFFSRQLQDHETKYSATELEYQAMVDTQIFRSSSGGSIYTNHKALTSLYL